MDEYVRRSYLFDILAAADETHGNIITGRPIVYNSATDIGGYFQEIIDRGALDEADLTDVRFLVNHDMSKIPLARSRRNNDNSTMRFRVDSEGLLLERVDLDTENNSEARALYSAVQRGDISGMSFAFAIKDQRWENMDTDYPTRHITKISRVVEVSAVTWPAYESTSINARDNSALDSARTVLESAKRSLESDRKNYRINAIMRAYKGGN